MPTATVTAALTAFAMLAFAANSVLCRLALSQTTIDPATFTLTRIASGALALGVLVLVRGRRSTKAGSWGAAVALFAYAALFSFAYLTLSAGAGALLLFGAVQATMIVAGLVRGETLIARQWLGLVLALAGLTALLAPGVSAPPPLGAALMAGAGVAWGAYSLLGRRQIDPLAATAANFLRATPMALAVALVASIASGSARPPAGLLYAALSGALASGVGYVVWYSALPGLRAVQAASVQLSVPVITAIGGTFALGETISARLAVASTAVLGGIALVVLAPPRRA